jgi:N-acetylated-alpha-linked acidic dipeptidase
VAERLRAQKLIKAAPGDRREIRDRPDLRIGALGSGSDYTPFLQHLGIASLNLGYGGEEGGGCYHSIYDSYDHYTRFGDPGFEYGVVQVRTCGRVMLRLANAELLPYEFSDFAETIGKYAGEVSKLADDLRTGTTETNRWISEKLLLATMDPKEPFVPPQPKAPVPFLNFAPLQNAVATLQQSAHRFESLRAKAINNGSYVPNPDGQSALDKRFLQLEQDLVHPDGLPRRPWYRHVVYAPGFYTGYGVKTLPGIREAIEQRDWGETTQQISIAAEALEHFSNALNQCCSTWEKELR